MQNLTERETFRGFSPFHARSAALVAAQMEHRVFDPALVLGSAQCPWGYPQVILCRPCSRGKPFPTLFWLTCPYVAAASGRQVSKSRGALRENNFYNQGED